MKVTHNQLATDHSVPGQSSTINLADLLVSAQNSVTRLGVRARGFIMLLVLLLAAFAAMAPMFPRRVTPASASLERFSGERALAHLPVIAREPHPAGSPAQALVRDYLVQQLSAQGLEVEVQREPGLENVVARLRGAAPTGAILLQAHYDSIRGPGAADNGSGVAALLEIMRALSAGPALRNDVIALFDDSEELPDEFTGTKAFVRKHAWMQDVRVAIGMDTAVRGFICTNDTGPDNGWMVHVLARAYTGGAWSSISGGGTYDTKPFRQAGIRVLELEDNYPFYEQHTPGDVPAIVNPGTLQQLGEQALSVVGKLGDLDLSNTSGEQETYAYLPLLGLAHYPEAWSLPLAVLAGILLVVALGLALWRKLASWRGLGVAFLATVVAAALSAIGTNALWKAAPGLFGWETHRWSEWPEVIPPNGWQVLILSNLVVLVFTTVIYLLARRWSARANFSLVVLSIFLVPAVALAISTPRAAFVAIWSVFVGSMAWIVAAMVHTEHKGWLVDAGALFAAIPAVWFILPLIPAVFMGDGTKSVAITAGVWVVLLGLILPAVDGLFMRVAAQKRESEHGLTTSTA